MTNREWIDLISKEFNCSRSIAKEMLHAMYNTKRIKEFERKDEVRYNGRDAYGCWWD